MAEKIKKSVIKVEAESKDARDDLKDTLDQLHKELMDKIANAGIKIHDYGTEIDNKRCSGWGWFWGTRGCKQT
jgi:hypothetical protein